MQVKLGLIGCTTANQMGETMNHYLVFCVASVLALTAFAGSSSACLFDGKDDGEGVRRRFDDGNFYECEKGKWVRAAPAIVVQAIVVPSNATWGGNFTPLAQHCDVTEVIVNRCSKVSSCAVVATRGWMGPSTCNNQQAMGLRINYSCMRENVRVRGSESSIEVKENDSGTINCDKWN